MRLLLSVVAVFFFAVSCSPVSHHALNKTFSQTEVAFQDHVGFMLFDPEAEKVLYERKADRYFTPASNTKIFTLYTSLCILGDSVPGLKYVNRGDSLIFWGTGDPSFLYNEVYQNNKVYNFLANNTRTLYFSPANMCTPHFGSGWAWDDYNDYYSSERSSFPIYGNVFEVEKTPAGLIASPSYFQPFITVSGDSMLKETLTRDLTSNKLTYYPGSFRHTSWTKPFRTSTVLTTTLLADTLKKPVTPVSEWPNAAAQTIYSIPVDSLYKVMMQESDNFIAEQLLLLCASVLGDSLSPEITIRYAKENLLADLPDEPRWVDGSGLSRYNLFTPRSVVKLWHKIYQKVPRDRLFKILAVGGEAGTIKKSYKGDTTPYIYGKTGTLSNIHCLSGYLVTKKGKVLIFSFMNTNYTVSVRTVRQRMEEVLRTIYTNY